LSKREETSPAPSRALPTILAAVCAASAVCASRPALATAPNATNRTRLDNTVRYLQDAQNLDGGFGGNPGAESDPDFSAWVALALAAAGINPQDQAKPGGVDAYTYLAKHASELSRPNAECPRSSCTTELERVLLVVDAAGTSPHDFGGVDLVNAILQRRLSAGSFPHEADESTAGMNDTIFAVLALSPVHESAVQDAVRRAATWVQDQQNEDGSWSALRPQLEQGEVDMTGAAIEALNAAGRHNTQAQQQAFAYLHRVQDSDGGFPEHSGEGESNVASTAWAAQAMWSAGEDPEAWLTGSGQETEDPLAYMASLQQPDGHIRWKKSQDANGVWMTAYVAPAFAGQALPPAAAPRSVPSMPPSPSSGAATPPAPGTAEPGQGGESSQPGGGVIAGGGGNGAPLFSRPQPQSRGKTPGSARLLSSAHRPPFNRILIKHRGVAQHKPRVTHHATAASGGAHLTAAQAHGDGQADGREVKGVLIGAPVDMSTRAALEPGAPGLHGAGAGGNQTPWAAIPLASAIALLALTGSQLERRRPEVVL